MAKGRAVVGVGVFGAVLAAACASGPGARSQVDKYRGSWPAATLPTLDDGAAYRVPPDRARVPVAIRVSSRTEGANLGTDVRAELDALAASLPKHCAVEVLAYHPQVEGTAGIEAALEASFTGLTDVRRRMDRLDACLAAVRVHGTVDDGEREVVAGDALYVVDQPAAHFGPLVQRFTALQQAAASIDAPNVHPADRRCVPTGAVLPGSRRIDGVELTLEMSCAVAAPAPK